MKKALVVVVMLSYLAVSCGVMVNYHYCMNRLASTDIYKIPDGHCGTCGMYTTEANGCCRDEVRVVKMSDDQQVTVTADIVFSAPLPPLASPSAFLVAPFTVLPPLSNLVHPPPLAGNDLYLQLNVFRI